MVRTKSFLFLKFTVPDGATLQLAMAPYPKLKRSTHFGHSQFVCLVCIVCGFARVFFFFFVLLVLHLKFYFFFVLAISSLVVA